jgi:hypothetical protein
MRTDTAAPADTVRDRALELVAKRGWLSNLKDAWSLSKAVHAFDKPMNVVLAAETPDDIMQQLLLRSPIVAVQLEGSVVAPPLPNGVHELILSESFCGSVAELPQNLLSFKAVNMSRRSIAAVLRVLQLLPSSLQRFQLELSCFQRQRTPSINLLAAHLPALPHLKYLHLEGVDRSTSWPSSLQELCLISCEVSDELQLPVTLRKLKLAHCVSSRDSSEKILTVHLTEGLQQLEIRGWSRVELSSELPSSLTHLVLGEGESLSSVGALPSRLQHLELHDLNPLSLWEARHTLCPGLTIKRDNGFVFRLVKVRFESDSGADSD